MSISKTKFGHQDIVIPANGERYVPIASAESAYFYSQTGSFEIGLDGGQMVPWTKGRSFKLPQLDSIETIKIRDTSGSQNRVKFYFGNIDIIDSTLQVIENADLVAKRPDAAEVVFEDALVADTETLIITADTATAEVLAYNEGANPVDILNAVGERIDTLAAGEKARYIVTSGLKANSTLGTTLLLSRFFF